jgi:site-specific recombinase XerD
MEENLTKVTSAVSTPIALTKNAIIPDEFFSFEKLASLLIRFINQMKKTGKSSNTISAYRNDLTLFCEFLTEKQINPDNYTLPSQELWLEFLKENGRQSQASVRRAQMSVRSFLHFLVSEQVISQSPFLELKSPKQPAHVLLTVPHDKFLTLCKTLKSKTMTGDSKSIRDWTLILILGECGLKASEIANLTWGDVWPDVEEPKLESKLTEKSSVSVGCLRVKSGNEERLVPYSAEIAQALELLKEVRANLQLGVDLTSKLFFGYLNVSRKTRTDFLHRHGIKFVVYEVCSEILGVPYNSESLRNHAILRWIGKGLDNEKVAALAGYSSLNSLERFLRSPERKKSSKRKMRVTKHR